MRESTTARSAGGMEDNMYDFKNLWSDAHLFEALDVPNGHELFGAAIRNEAGEKLAIRGLASAIGSEINRGSRMRAPLPSMVTEALTYLIASSEDSDRAGGQATEYVINPFPGLTPSLSAWILEQREA